MAPRTTRLAVAAAALALPLSGCGGAARGTAERRPAEAADAACFDQGRKLEGDARLFIEHNATDEDSGLHGMFGHEGLATGCLRKPDGTRILLVDPAGELDALGINELFFESREPPAEEYSLGDLRDDFPEGEYRISGVDFEGTRRVGVAVLTHDVPRAPEIVSPRVVPEEEAKQNVVPAAGLTVRWQPVSRTVDGAPVEVSGYEVIVTKVEHDDPHGLSRPEYDVHVPPAATDLAVPDAFLEPGTLYELEVLALEASGNQTISVGFFTTARSR